MRSEASGLLPAGSSPQSSLRSGPGLPLPSAVPWSGPGLPRLPGRTVAEEFCESRRLHPMPSFWHASREVRNAPDAKRAGSPHNFQCRRAGETPPVARAPVNVPEAIAVISDEVLEAAWDGASLAEVIERGRSVFGPGDVMDGVREIVRHLEIEALFPSGTALVDVDDPVGTPVAEECAGRPAPSARRRDRRRELRPGHGRSWSNEYQQGNGVRLVALSFLRVQCGAEVRPSQCTRDAAGYPAGPRPAEPRRTSPYTSCRLAGLGGVRVQGARPRHRERGQGRGLRWSARSTPPAMARRRVTGSSRQTAALKWKSQSDDTSYGDEILGGCGKTMRDGMLATSRPAADSRLDMLISNVVVIDPVLGGARPTSGSRTGKLPGWGGRATRRRR